MHVLHFLHLLVHVLHLSAAWHACPAPPLHRLLPGMHLLQPVEVCKYE